MPSDVLNAEPETAIHFKPKSDGAIHFKPRPTPESLRPVTEIPSSRPTPPLGEIIGGVSAPPGISPEAEASARQMWETPMVPVPRLPDVSKVPPTTAEKALPLGGGVFGLSSPVLTILDKVLGPEQKTAVNRAIANVAIQGGAGFTSPKMLAMLGVTAAAPPVGLAWMTADQILGAKEVAQQAGEKSVTGTLQEKVEAYLNLAQLPMFTVATGLGTVGAAARGIQTARGQVSFSAKPGKVSGKMTTAAPPGTIDYGQTVAAAKELIAKKDAADQAVAQAAANAKAQGLTQSADVALLPVEEIGPGKSPIPEVEPIPSATPARGEGASPPPTPAESGAPVKAATPAVTGPPAEGAAGPAIRPTTTEVAPSQVGARSPMWEALKKEGLTDDDVFDILGSRTSVSEVVERRLRPYDVEYGGGPDHAKALEEARLNAVARIEAILERKPTPASQAEAKPAEPSAKPEGGTSAVQVRSAEALPVDEPSRGGESMGKGVRAGQEPAVPQEPVKPEAEATKGAGTVAGAQGKVRGEVEPSLSDVGYQRPEGIVILRALATGKKSRWVKTGGKWYRMVAGKPKGRGLLPDEMALSRKLEDELSKQLPPGETGVPVPDVKKPGLVSGTKADAWASDVIRKKLGGAGANPFADPEFMAAVIVRGAGIVERGVRDFAAWSTEMVHTFGEDVRPHLDHIFQVATGMAAHIAQRPGGDISGVQVSLPPARQAKAIAPPAATGPAPPVIGQQATAPAPGQPVINSQGTVNLAAGQNVPAKSLYNAGLAINQQVGVIGQQAVINRASNDIARYWDAATTRAGTEAHAESQSVEMALRRAFKGRSRPGALTTLAKIVWPSLNELEKAKMALSFVIETGVPDARGRTGVGRLADFKNTIQTSPYANRGWAKAAVRSIEYAERHFNELAPVARQARDVMDKQMAREAMAGFKVTKRPGYVMHMQEVQDPYTAGLNAFLGDPGRGGSGASFLKERTHATFADSIAAGVDPQTLDAMTLIEARLRQGKRMVNTKAWESQFRNTLDPINNVPIFRSLEHHQLPNGNWEQRTPRGYQLVSLGGHPVAVLGDYAKTVRSLVMPSQLDRLAWRAFLKGAGVGKHFLLMMDTYHLGRIGFWAFLNQNTVPNLARGQFNIPFKYRRGLTMLDMTRKDMVELAARGEIPREWLTQMHEDKAVLDDLMREGYNVGGVSDAMWRNWAEHIPVTGAFTKWLFTQYQRGAMAQAGLVQFRRMQARFPNLSREEVAAMVARDLNFRFGNLQSQGWIKSKTWQDLSRLLMLSPQWNESLIRSEGRAFLQAGKAGLDAASGKRAAYGVMMRSVGSAVVSIFAANQIINMITKGHPTWMNTEEGSKFDAWIPDLIGEGTGYWLSPVALPLEISHLMLKNFERAERREPDAFQAGVRALTDYLTSRKSYPVTALMAVLGFDPFGQKVKSNKYYDNLLKLTVPSPIGGPAVVVAARQAMGFAPPGQTVEKFSGQAEKQIMQSMGIKTETAPSPGQKLSQLAQEWMKKSGKQRDPWPYESDYKNLDSLLRAKNYAEAAEEYKALLKTKTPAKVHDRYLQRVNRPFTRNAADDVKFRRSLSDENKALWSQAIEERRELLRRFRQMRELSKK